MICVQCIVVSYFGIILLYVIILVYYSCFVNGLFCCKACETDIDLLKTTYLVAYLLCSDLSFNNIEVIEGLDKLTQLEDLTLFNNRIQCLENMDTLTKLHVFSIGNNDLKELDNVCKLSRS